MKQYLEKGDSMKVEVEELESPLGPEDSEVDFTRILEEVRNEKGRAIFEVRMNSWLSAERDGTSTKGKLGYAEGGIQKNGTMS